MTDMTVDADSIGPQLNLTGVTLPNDVGRQIARSHGIDDTIRTAAEWAETTKQALGTEGGNVPTADDLCTSPDGRHSFTARDSEHSQSYVCVLDPLIYPFLADTPGTVVSETPVREEIVEIEVHETAATATYEDAVISLGASTDVDPDARVTFERVYAQVCGYVHVFADQAEYEQWRDNAATMAVPVAEGVAIARELTTALFER